MNPEVVAAVIAASVSFLTLIGTLAAQYFGRRATSKQLDRTLAEQRTRTLNERFATAAEQLGSDKPAVRLAGVYAMAGLADDWKENRQTCVDVLCAYLRLPYEPDPGQDAPEQQRLAFQAIREVRHTVIRVITAHLQKDAPASWQGLSLDFTGVVFDGGDFSSAQFSGAEVRFSSAQFSSGTVDFSSARFSGGTVDFSSARFSGAEVGFSSAQFSGGTVDFSSAQFSSGTVGFSDARFSGGTVHFGYAQFCGGTAHFIRARFSGGTVHFGALFSGGRVDFGFALFSGAEVGFSRAKFSGGRVGFGFVQFSGGTVDFNGAEFSGAEVGFVCARFSGGAVGFSDAEFSAGTVDFNRAEFSGAEVRFSNARFSGGTVTFHSAGDWSFPPAFPWMDTPPPGVKLPKKEDQSQA